MRAAFAVLTIEHERGWGSKPDGYLIFKNEEAATAYVHEQTKDRKPFQAPDYYVSYEMCGYQVCSEAFEKKVETAERGFVYVDSFKEML